MKKPFLKTLSLVLTLALIINMLPLHVFARDEEEASVSNPFVDVAEEPTPAEIVGEETSLRSEVEKHFRLSDGSYIAVSYGMPIHYQDTAGSWQDIDNSLALSADQTAYQSANAEVDSAFSADLSAGNLVSTGYGNVAVTMGLLDTAQALALTQQDGAMAAEDETAGLVYDRDCEAILVSDISTFVQLDDVPGWSAEELLPESLSSTVLYEDIYPNVDIRYTAYSYNIKEEIIVKAAQSAYRYDFFLSVDGATAALNQDGSISISNEDGDLVYFIPAPYMRDATGDSSRAVSYTLTPAADGMVLTVEADAAWINDENRAFPVTIDPSLEASVGTWTTDESADIYPHGNHGTGQLSVTSLLHAFPIPLVVFKRFQNILFGLLGCDVFWEIRFQPFRLEADFFFLVRFLLTHNTKDGIHGESTSLRHFPHFDCL